jgi:hypothetical protein
MARAQAKLTLANLAYNFNRLIFHERRAATGQVHTKSAETAERPIKTGPQRTICLHKQPSCTPHAAPRPIAPPKLQSLRVSSFWLRHRSFVAHCWLERF